MELASILHQYQPELESNYADRLLPGHRRAAHRMPGRYGCSAPIAPRHSHSRIPAATVVAPGASTMKPACGWTGNGPSCCRSSILW